jgi:transcriptional regulator with XRE-family HTH domain
MTIRQLAASLGMSKSTVAYALRGSPEVSAETREHVQQRARELGYTPNPVASAFLQQVRSQGAQRYQANLAFLRAGKPGAVPEGAHRPPSEAPYIRDLTAGARERSAELGYGLDEIYVGGYTSRQLTRMLLARGVLGVGIAPLSHAVGHVTLDWSRFAAAAYGHSMVRPLVHRIVHDHAHSMRTLLRICRRKGFRRIGLALSTESDRRSDRHWSSSYLGLQLGQPAREHVPPLLIPLSQYTPERVCEWARLTRPDLVILHATGYVPALAGALRRLQPRPLPYVVLDREASDDCAGIDQRFGLCGRLLIDALSSQILHNQRGLPDTPITSMVKGVWVDHPALRPPPRRKSASPVARPIGKEGGLPPSPEPVACMPESKLVV